MGSFDPLVSIIIPVYNGSNYLKESIDSALAQSYKNIEILVINDGSKDNGLTEAIAKSYGNKIRYFAKENGGGATALNFGIEEMQGDYFSWLSHDDVYYPKKIEAQISVLNNASNKETFVFAGWETIDHEGNVLYKKKPLQHFSNQQLNIPLFPLFNGLINGCSLLIHKNHFKRAGVFKEDLLTTQDVDLWFRMMRGNSCIVYNGILHKSRLHPAQSSNEKKSIHETECNHFWINAVNQLTDDEKRHIGGTVPKFYRSLYYALNRYGYGQKAKEYIKEKLFLNKNIYSRFFINVMLNIWIGFKLLYELISMVSNSNPFYIFQIVKMRISRNS